MTFSPRLKFMLENCDLVSQLKIEMIYFVTVTSFRSQECQSRCSEDFSIPVEEDFKLEFCFLAKDEGSGEESQRRYVGLYLYCLVLP